MKENLKIRATHHYAFRSGEWADFRGTARTEFEPYRWCYLVEFPDGVKDLWVIDDKAHGYEFMTVTDEQ